MKAILWKKYGPPEVLHMGEVEKPTPKPNEVLIKIHAATVTPGDCEIRRFDIHPLFWLFLRILVGITRPRRHILGMEVAGEIESIGKDVKKFKVGDQIFASMGLHFGAYALYACLPETAAMVTKPGNLSYEEVVGVPVGGLNALHFLRKGKVQKGEKVLINGAGGSIGTFGIQLAKYFGAEVTAVDSTIKLEALRSIGADHVIDYTQEDFTKNGETYDIIFDVAGKSPYSQSLKSLKKNGRYLLANPPVLHMLRAPFTSMISSKKVIFEFANETVEQMLFLKGLLEEGKIKPLIDRRYSLEQMVEAHHYVESGQKTGIVVITLEHD